MSWEKNQQKKIFVATALLLILFIIILLLIWYKNDLLKNKAIEKPSDTSTTVIEINTEVEKTEKQKIIEQIAPNTDLTEFDVPDNMLNEFIMENPVISPIYNRTGRILDIDLKNSTILFLDRTFEKIEKTYKVLVTKETEIQINTIYENNDKNQPKNTTKIGTLSDLQIDDNVSIKAEQKINSDTFSALIIKTNRFISNNN